MLLILFKECYIEYVVYQKSNTFLVELVNARWQYVGMIKIAYGVVMTINLKK